MNYQHWHGVQDPKFGYGAMLEGFLQSAPPSVTLNEKASVNVHMGVPYSVGGWLEGQHKVCFTMWETDTLPASFVRWLYVYDQILVPCDHNVELFSQHHQNVQKVVLGVDNLFWKPQKTNQNSTYRFHAGGSLWNRKGLDIVVKAFNNLKLPNAELHIKAAPHADDTPTQNLGPNVYLHRNWMDLKEQRTWFSQADCFIAASRGEGFGLMPLQAIAMGIPTIVSDSTGQSQFKHLATGVIPCGKSMAVTIGQWDEPNLEALMELMLHHYNHPEETKAQAKLNAPKTKEFSWDNATAQLIAALPQGSLLKTKTWEKAEVTVSITLKRNLKCDIGKESFVFTKGVTYEVSENVHQVLFDAKVLA
jgi:glycosyltransferase involved in cell wall biosynthesis